MISNLKLGIFKISHCVSQIPLANKSNPEKWDRMNAHTTYLQNFSYL